MKTKLVSLLIAVGLISAVANLVALKTIRELEIKNQIYAQSLDIYKQKIADCISDRNAAVRAAVPATK